MVILLLQHHLHDDVVDDGLLPIGRLRRPQRRPALVPRKGQTERRQRKWQRTEAGEWGRHDDTPEEAGQGG